VTEEGYIAAGWLRVFLKRRFVQSLTCAGGGGEIMAVTVIADLDPSRQELWASDLSLVDVKKEEAHMSTDHDDADRSHGEGGGDDDVLGGEGGMGRGDWTPEIDDKTGEWVLGRRDVKAISIGAGVLGAGGGGSPYLAEVKLLNIIKSR